MDSRMAILFAFVFLLGTVQVLASDPQLTTDFFVPPGVNASTIDGAYFTFDGLVNVTPKPGPFATVTPANSGAAGYTALTGLGVSYSLITYPPKTINRPHTHPRGTELLYVIEGYLDVGLLSSEGKLFSNSIGPGQLFVFPEALIHFQINWDPAKTTTALAAFSSSNAGTIIVPPNIFGSKPPINDQILAQSFGVSLDVIAALKAGQM